MAAVAGGAESGVSTLASMNPMASMSLETSGSMDMLGEGGVGLGEAGVGRVAVCFNQPHRHNEPGNVCEHGSDG